MRKNRFRICLDFNLTTKKGEKLDKNSIKQLKNLLKRWLVDDLTNEHCFYAYFDGKDGSYDTDISPTNVKCKIQRLE